MWLCRGKTKIRVEKFDERNTSSLSVLSAVVKISVIIPFYDKRLSALYQFAELHKINDALDVRTSLLRIPRLNLDLDVLIAHLEEGSQVLCVTLAR